MIPTGSPPVTLANSGFFRFSITSGVISQSRNGLKEHERGRENSGEKFREKFGT
jgi:hypothetical protein